MHNSYTRVLLGDNLGLKMPLIEKLLLFPLFSCHGYKKWKHFELFHSLHFNKKCWLLRCYMHNCYTLMLLGDNLG